MWSLELYADLTANDIETLYDQLTEIYGTMAPSDAVDHIEALLQSSGTWKKTGVGRHSVVFAAAM